MSAFFPLQSIQVLWTRGATTCEDCGRVGQRDQGLVSEKEQYLRAVCFDLSALIYLFSAKNTFFALIFIGYSILFINFKKQGCMFQHCLGDKHALKHLI